MHYKTRAALAKQFSAIYEQKGEKETIDYLLREGVSEEDAPEVIATIATMLASGSQDAPPEEESVPHEAEKVTEGKNLYDMYKVNRRFTEVGGESVVEFDQVGNPVRTGVKITPEQANIFNNQSRNTGIRLYPAL